MMNGENGSSDHQGAVDWSFDDALDNFLNEFQTDSEKHGRIVDTTNINPHYAGEDIMSALDSGTNMVEGSSNMQSQTGIPQPTIPVSSLNLKNGTTHTTQIRTIMGAPITNPNYPSHPIMCTMKDGSNLSGDSSNLAHVDYSQQTVTVSSLIPDRSTIMPATSGQISAATELITASLDIKNPNQFPTRDAWREYALRKVQKLKEEYYKEIFNIHQNTARSSRTKEKNFEEVKNYEQFKGFLEALMLFMQISSVNAFPKDDHTIHDYLNNIVALMIYHKSKNNNVHRTFGRSYVPCNSSHSAGPSSRRPPLPRTRNSRSLNNGSLEKRAVNPLRVSSTNASPLSSASPVETQKLKIPIQETTNSKDPLLDIVDVVQPMSSKSMVSALNDISCVPKVMGSIPECPPSYSTRILQHENEPQRKTRRTLNVLAYQDQIFSDEWDIDFLETILNMKQNTEDKGFLLDEIRETNFELLETSLVVVETADEYYARVLGGQGGTIVKCFYTNICFPEVFCPQKIPDFVLEMHVPTDYPANSSPKIFHSYRNILSEPWDKLYDDILAKFDVSLGEIHGRVCLADLARKWDTSARLVLTEFVEEKYCFPFRVNSLHDTSCLQNL